MIFADVDYHVQKLVKQSLDYKGVQFYDNAGININKK